MNYEGLKGYIDRLETAIKEKNWGVVEEVTEQLQAVILYGYIRETIAKIGSGGVTDKEIEELLQTILTASGKYLKLKGKKK